MALNLKRECTECGKAISVTTSDPIISAASLGNGFFHEECAKKRWDERREKAESHREEVFENRSAAAKARVVAGLGPNRLRSCKSCGAKIESASSSGLKLCSDCLSVRQASEVEDE